jgi:hypothetical protein
VGSAELGQAVGPRRGRCEGCGAPVLRVLVAGRLVAVEPRESLPSMPCPDCRFKSAGRRARCRRCGGTLRVGGLPEAGVALGDGGARPYRRGRGREEGDAVHALHECGGARARPLRAG